MDFSQVPYGDVISFLNLRGVDISDDPNENYEIGASLITEVDRNDQIPVSIADFMIAYNLYGRMDEIDIYKMSDIYTNKVDPNRQLRLDFTDKDRISRILSYLGKLDNDLNIYEKIPVPILVNIMSNLSLSDIMSLCSSSRYLNQQCSDVNFWIALIQTKDSSFIPQSDVQQIDINQLKRRYGFLTSSKNGWPLGSGLNDFHQLSNVSGVSLVPTRISDVGKCIHMSSTRSNTVFILEDGRAVLKGDNRHGQLGTDDNNVESTTIDPSNGEYFVMGSIASNTICLLLSDGRVLMYGEPQNDELRSIDNPYLNIEDFVVKIFSYVPHFHVFITNEDKMILYKPGGFDRSPVSQVLMSTIDTSITTSMIIKNIDKVAYNPNSTLYILLKSGDLLYLSNNNPNFKYVELNGIIDISMGLEYFILLRNDGTVFYRETDSVRYDMFKQIEGLSTVVDIASGDDHAMFLMGDGSVYGMKSEEVGLDTGIFGFNVGDITTTDSTGTVKQYNISDTARSLDNHAIFPPIKVIDKSNIVQIEAGSDITLYLTSDPPGSGSKIDVPSGNGYATININ
jgi:F-box domain